MSFNKELFNQYIINFKNNQPLTVWAKNYEIIALDNGVDRIEFIDTHIDSRINYINSNEVLYIETKRCNIALEV